ncbi:MAG: SDR family oxidoreductase [Variibacter sp.]
MVTDLKDKIVWVTGAGTGIGEAAALALAKEGAKVILTGRREDVLKSVADRIAKAGGTAHVAAADVTDAKAIEKVAADIKQRFGRLDILVNNAGVNITERRWRELNPERIKLMLDTNLTSACYCAAAALNIMRPQKDGLLIHTASMAGKVVGLLSGPAYVAAKHGVVAMSHTINMEEFANGIRSTVLCPGEVATPILDKRPVPVSKEDRDRMLQPDDMASLILYVAKLPPSVCINEVLINPTWNRGYAVAAGIGPKIA